jgi:hypothetical protein
MHVPDPRMNMMRRTDPRAILRARKKKPAANVPMIHVARRKQK